MGCVYWIHLPEHTDFMTQGYIGITTRTADKRFAQHRSEAKLGRNNTLYKAMRKHGDKIVLTTLVIANEAYCLNLERKIRPSERIGWNIVPGGGKPPVNTNHTESAKAKIAAGVKARGQTEARVAAVELKRGVSRSEESKAKMREKAQGRLPWDTSRADKSLWARAGEIYQFWQANSHLGYVKLGQHFGYPKEYALKNMYLKFKQSWNPLEDPEWLGWIQTQTI